MTVRVARIHLSEAEGPCEAVKSFWKRVRPIRADIFDVMWSDCEGVWLVFYEIDHRHVEPKPSKPPRDSAFDPEDDPNFDRYLDTVGRQIA